MILNYEKFKQLIPTNRESREWYEIARIMFDEYSINTPLRIAGFMAQCAYESSDFKTLSENLNYSAERLNEVFPKYFIRAGRDANAYHRNPEKIANVVYANRMGNGSIASGDGWRYRGGGIIQLTGKNNHSAFAKSVGKSLEESSDYVRTKKGALEAACWFWKANNLNRFCDNNDVVGLTRAINGGYKGLEGRRRLWNNALVILGGRSLPNNSPTIEVIRQGAKGAEVSKIQKALGITEDGDFGPATHAAVKKWQLKKGLVSDGIVGPATYNKMF